MYVSSEIYLDPQHKHSFFLPHPKVGRRQGSIVILMGPTELRGLGGGFGVFLQYICQGYVFVVCFDILAVSGFRTWCLLGEGWKQSSSWRELLSFVLSCVFVNLF